MSTYKKSAILFDGENKLIDSYALGHSLIVICILETKNSDVICVELYCFRYFQQQTILARVLSIKKMVFNWIDAQQKLNEKYRVQCQAELTQVFEPSAVQWMRSLDTLFIAVNCLPRRV